MNASTGTADAVECQAVAVVLESLRQFVINFVLTTPMPAKLCELFPFSWINQRCGEVSAPWMGFSCTAAKRRHNMRNQLQSRSTQSNCGSDCFSTRSLIIDYAFVPFLRAGVGRTGTFIGLWNLMDAVDAGPDSSGIDVYQTVLNMRKNRPIMVQTIVRVAQGLSQCNALLQITDSVK